MLIKELPKETNLVGKKLKTPKGVVGYFVNAFTGGIFLNNTPGDPEDGVLYPQIFVNPEGVLNCEVVEDSVGSNCDILKGVDRIMNV